ncbi:hypothetical protein EDB19DRAFT_1832459 [Suillus lakei]|nr:hypothetical protein EDB19DRAFT_1832459 [Suillus lakei]
MRLSLLAVVLAWTASIFVSATVTSPVFNTTCRIIGKTCDEDSDCCSDMFDLHPGFSISGSLSADCNRIAVANFAMLTKKLHKSRNHPGGWHVARSFQLGLGILITPAYLYDTMNFGVVTGHATPIT